MSGDKMRTVGGGEGAEYSHKGPAAGGPAGYGNARPAVAAAGAPPGYRAPPRQANPQRHYAQPQPQYAPPQPQYASTGYNADPQMQQMPPPNVVYGIPPPPPNPSHGYQQQPVGAPPMQQQVQMMAPMGQWTTGLCDCGEDPSNAVITFFLPCITFGQVAEVVDQGTTSCLMAGSVWTTVLICFGMPCFVSCLWRTKLRAKYNLPQDEIGDFCLHFWCESCALCQEYRELSNRGLNPSLGWEYHRQQLYAQSMQAPMGAPQQVYMQR